MKFQRCGKENCHCKKGKRHGPYFWLVRYIKPQNQYEKGKYKWNYIGRKIDDLELFYTENHERYNLDPRKVEKIIDGFKAEIGITTKIKSESSIGNSD